MQRPLFALFALALTGCPQEISVIPDAGTPPAPRKDASVVPTDAGQSAPDATCVPRCTPGQCGPDPACGLPCGCEPGLSCSPAGRCEASCAPGSTVCVDSSGFSACGLNPALGVYDQGPRVPCSAGDPCEAGTCAHQRCTAGEVMLLVDRSATLSFDSTWLWVREALGTWAGARDQGSAFGLRLFPDVGCTARTALSPRTGSGPDVSASYVAPGSDPARPIEAAFTDLASQFGPPREGQAVVLVTAGDDTCGDQAATQVAQLFRAGIRTFVVGIHGGGDPGLLDELARKGGTRSARSAGDLATLTATLAAISGELGLCSDPHAQIGAGTYHSCGLGVDGRLACWGIDLYDESSPPGGTYSQLGVGGLHSCAVSTEGALRCWGRDDRGQLQAPVGTFQDVASGDQHACALRLDGTAVCWGHNNDGQADAPAGVVFKDLTCGGFFSCGVRMDNTLQCWGAPIAYPRAPVRAVDGGAFHLCAVMMDGSLDCGGRAVPSGTFVAVSAGDDHDCALHSSGQLTCFGSNTAGQTDVPAGLYAAVSANYQHTCAVSETDEWVCWGSNTHGQTSPP